MDEASLRAVMYRAERRRERKVERGEEWERGGQRRGARDGWRVKAAALIHLKSAVIYHSDNTH